MEIELHYDPFWTGFLWHDAKAIYIQHQHGAQIERFPKTEAGYRAALAAIEPCKVLAPPTVGGLSEETRAVTRDIIRNNLRLKSK